MAEAMGEERRERLAQISDRNRQLCEVPFETHGPEVEHGPVCIPCQLVRAIGDVTWLLERLGEIGETSVEYAALYTSWANSSTGETKAIGPFKTTDELLAAQEGELWPIGRDSWSLGTRLAGQWRPTDWREVAE